MLNADASHVLVLIMIDSRVGKARYADHQC
jgi:hypothetical protein